MICPDFQAPGAVCARDEREPASREKARRPINKLIANRTNDPCLRTELQSSQLPFQRYDHVSLDAITSNSVRDYLPIKMRILMGVARKSRVRCVVRWFFDPVRDYLLRCLQTDLVTGSDRTEVFVALGDIPSKQTPIHQLVIEHKWRRG